MAWELASPGDEHGKTVVALFSLFVNNVTDIVEVEPLDIEAAIVASRKCCQLYVALEKEALSNGDHYNWTVKPKLHLFAELTHVTVKTSGAPQLFWTYLDEGWNAWLRTTCSTTWGSQRPKHNCIETAATVQGLHG